MTDIKKENEPKATVGKGSGRKNFKTNPEMLKKAQETRKLNKEREEKDPNYKAQRLKAKEDKKMKKLTKKMASVNVSEPIKPPEQKGSNIGISEAMEENIKLQNEYYKKKLEKLKKSNKPETNGDNDENDDNDDEPIEQPNEPEPTSSIPTRKLSSLEKYKLYLAKMGGQVSN